jgi:peptidase S24-like protein
VADAPVELDVHDDDQAPTRTARVRPEALIEIVRAAVSAGGAIWIRVTGKSMNPLIRHGDRVLLASQRGAPRRGQVVLLDAGGSPLLHRIVRGDGESVVTRGDNRRTSDRPHPTSSIVAHALVVRRSGTSICLAPTLAFGLMPLVRAGAWWLRVRLPDIRGTRFRREPSRAS